MYSKMSEENRDAFLSEGRIAIVAIERENGPPLAVPIWFSFDPEVGLTISTQDDSLKARLLRKAGRFTLTVQQEERPHRYVSAEARLWSFGPWTRKKTSAPWPKSMPPTKSRCTSPPPANTLPRPSS